MRKKTSKKIFENIQHTREEKTRKEHDQNSQWELTAVDISISFKDFPKICRARLAADRSYDNTTKLQ